jgi:FkbM family methyltransferase
MSKIRYYVRRMLCAALQATAVLLPRLTILDAGVRSLSYVRSRYGPYILNTPGDRTFDLCAGGYGNFISDAIVECDKPFVFLDIGANLGIFSLLAAQNPHCSSIVSIEPIPRTFEILIKNLDRNGVRFARPVLGAVFCSGENHVWLSYSPNHSGMSRIVESPESAIRASIVTSAMLDERVVGSGMVAVKIDVEGAELEVVRALRQTTFFHRIDRIIIEISESNLGVGRRFELLSLLDKEGFRERSRSGTPRHYDAMFMREEGSLIDRRL